MEEGGIPPIQQRTLTVCNQGIKGDTPTRQSAPPVRSQGMKKKRGPPTQQRTLPAHSQGIEGDTATRQRAARGWRRGGGIP